MRVRAILAMSSMAIGGVGMFAVSWVATHQLTPRELGYFFSFLSLGSLIQLSDFGLSYATLVSVSRLTQDGMPYALPAIGRFVARMNLLVSSVSAAVVAIIGFALFSNVTPEAVVAPITWEGPWVTFVLGILFAQWCTPGMSLREGSGKATQIWRLRLAQEAAGALACLTVLGLGAGLWSLGTYAVSRALVVSVWLNLGDPLRMAHESVPFPARTWIRECWPFQWRIGLSALAGFLIFRAFSPLILMEQGPVHAGQFGLSVAIMNLLVTVTLAWPLSQTARYSSLLALGRVREFDREFSVILISSSVVAVSASVTLSLALWQARELGVVFAERLTDPAVTMVILFAAVVHHVVGCIAVFLRAEGREPLLIPSVVGGIATIFVLWLAAHNGTLMDVAIANLLMAMIGIPIAGLIYWRRRRHRIG